MSTTHDEYIKRRNHNVKILMLNTTRDNDVTYDNLLHFTNYRLDFEQACKEYDQHILDILGEDSHIHDKDIWETAQNNLRQQIRLIVKAVAHE